MPSFFLPRLLCLLIFALSGCGGSITPPRYVRQPVTVYVKLDARHSAIVLPRSDDRYVEYSFGAFRWFAYADTRWPVALGSLLGFMRSTIQSDEVPIIDGIPQTLAQRGMIPLQVERSRADALRMQLDARFDRHRDTYHYNEGYGMSFVEDQKHYHVFNNCNQVTARWLRQLGCRVEGLTLSNDFRLAGEGSPLQATESIPEIK